ncbi:hypothetical protein SH661x_000113 [Planctomicrobium sp. SH661]|uniref:hypothetical protein n=1 Tax=Planctomicrobium sp. SH661 TaxID=3448124 RepID=UPI003F5CA35C
MTNPPPVPVRGRRPRVETERVPVQPAASAENGVVTLERTPWVRAWEYANGEGGASFLISFLLHLVVLGALAIPVMQQLEREETITSVIQNGDQSQLAIGDPGGMELALARIEPSSGNTFQNLLIDSTSLAPTLLPNVNPSDLPSIPGVPGGGKGGRGKGGGTGIGDGIGGEGGIRIMEPPNAVRAGNFSVWAWPIIKGVGNEGRVVHGPPGSAPASLQPYHIVIRLKVPEGRKSVRLADFSGQVKGTDGYVQKIPLDAWYFNAGGDLVRARTGRSIPVIDGTAELLIRVPGAQAEVRDQITVASRLTEEEQQIELQFQDRNN